MYMDARETETAHIDIETPNGFFLFSLCVISAHSKRLDVLFAVLLILTIIIIIIININMSESHSSLQSLIYTAPGEDDDAATPPSLKVLDQLLLPQEKKYINVPNAQAAWTVIRNMQIRGMYFKTISRERERKRKINVPAACNIIFKNLPIYLISPRLCLLCFFNSFQKYMSGAPLIAIVAALGLAVDLCHPTTVAELDQIEEMNGTDHGNAVLAYITGKMNYLATSRPTAVNIFHALDEIKVQLVQAMNDASSSDGGNTMTTARQRMVHAILKHASFMLERDRNDCLAMGRHGADAILKDKPSDAQVTIVTICNTGSLATSHYGTALGVVRAIRDRQQLKKIVALETRPYNQGSRLTAFEIVEEKMPGGTLICDSMAAALMAGPEVVVDAVVVGADRVCANGDTANKIGTYSLSLVAAAHHVPFYVASPFTTLDVNLPCGDEIPIEQRPAAELLSSSLAPPDIAVWNPSFDVTPAKYISGIITEKGVIYPNVDGKIDVAAFVAKHKAVAAAAAGEDTQEQAAAAPAAAKLVVPFNYVEQSIDSIPAYLAKHSPNTMNVLATTDPDDLKCIEVGDGNLNLVFIVTNKKDESKQVIVKQALPYVRCVGESWPLTLERAFFEYKALCAQKQACPEFVPSIYFFSKPHGLMVMQYLPPPNIILRKGLIQGIRYPSMARDMGVFCAKTLFSTSGFCLSATELRTQVEFWSTNREMCALTEQVVFLEPYMEASNNRWTSPQLDNDKKAIEGDIALKVAAARNKAKFVSLTQALIHADLHTGSVMCSPKKAQTFVIDPEFAFYGPMGFDTGAFIANMFLAYCSQPGQDNDPEYADWILQQIQTFWDTFVAEFNNLWNDASLHTGFLYSRAKMDTDEAVQECQKIFAKDILHDTLSFCGMKMLRRIVGIAHVEDLESISNADLRATCERHALETAKTFIKTAESISTIAEAIEIARAKKCKAE
jgi:5-methylthioribose kinase